MSTQSAIAINTAKEKTWWRNFSPNMVFVLTFGFVALFFVLGKIFGDPYNNGVEILFPETVKNPPLTWVFNILIPIGSTLFFIWATYDSIKKKSFTYSWLFFVAGCMTFWAESVGDWGFGLTYSPAFPGYTWPFAFPWHVGHNPYFMPFAYGFYWGTHGWLMTTLLRWWRKKTGMSEFKSLLFFAIPFGFAWDFIVEGTATYFGWWQYEPVIGPHVSWASGGNMPLLVPIILFMAGWPNFVVWISGDPRTSLYKLGRIERMFNLERFLPDNHPSSPKYLGDPLSPPKKFALKYEIYRFFAWVSVFWISMAIMQIIPYILLRYGIHMESIFAPFPVL